jgi:hypothetical protein
MSEIHEGECIGGPFDGRKLAHAGSVVQISSRTMADQDVEFAFLAGIYVWDKDKWRWGEAPASLQVQ